MLPDSNVSRRHAELRRKGDGVFVTGPRFHQRDQGERQSHPRAAPGQRRRGQCGVDETHLRNVVTTPAAVADLLATQNLNAVLHILQWGVIALIFIFFLRVIRAVWVEIEPGHHPQAAFGSAGRKREERAAALPVDRPSPRRRQLYLKVVQPPPYAGRTYDLDDELTIGRSPGCGVAMATTSTRPRYTPACSATTTSCGSRTSVRPTAPTSTPNRSPRRSVWARATCSRSARPCSRCPVTVLRSGSATDVGRVRTITRTYRWSGPTSTPWPTTSAGTPAARSAADCGGRDARGSVRAGANL